MTDSQRYATAVKVLAFDIATSTGVAWGVAGETPRACTHDLGKGLSEAQRFAKLIKIAHMHIQARAPDLIAYEAPIGGKDASAYLIGLAACVQGAAAACGYEPEQIWISQYRKHFLGKHVIARDFPGVTKAQAKRQIKTLVVNRCRALGWRPTNDDEADAMAIWDFACAKHRAHQSVPVGGLFRG